ncbi:MAG: mandelate racemase/muconate lactonizing enzyme family protein [Sandaracinaceae bacterium]
MRTRLTTVHAPIPGTANAVERWTSRTVVRIELFGPRGLGLGEAAPLPGVSPDRFRDVRRDLEAYRWPDDVRSVEDIRAATRGVRSPSARFGIETALLDYLSRSQDLPICALLAAYVPPRLALAQALWVETDDALRLALAEAIAKGVKCVKLKVGRAGRAADEIRWLETVRKRAPNELELRLDANRALPPAEAEALLHAYVPFGPSFLEEPVPFEDLLELKSPIPIALDESLAGDGGSQRLERALEAEAVDVLVLKPTLLGGILACLDLADSARRANLRCVVSHLLEGPISRAASAHLALAVGGLAAGLGQHPALSPLADGIRVPFVGAAWIKAPSYPGLGLGISW